MIYTEISFDTNDIGDITIVLPSVPRVDEIIEFPSYALKYRNGAEVEERFWRVKNIWWVLKPASFMPYLAFSKVQITVEPQ